MRILLNLLLLFSCATLCAEAPGIYIQPGGRHPFHEWRPWQPLQLGVSYFNLTRDDGNFHLWFNASFEGRDSLIRLEGADLDHLERTPPQFDTRIVKNYDLDLDGLPSPLLSRASGLRLRDGTELVQGSVGPRYRGGGSELFPALFLRKEDDAWHHLGPPPGEPEDLLNAIRAHAASVRSEGGGLIELPDGRLRIYLHGLPEHDRFAEMISGNRLIRHSLLVAESDHPEGPWTFLREQQGERINLYPADTLPWLFVHVQPLGDTGYMLTGADQWPPKNIYAAYSTDGLHFVTPADPDTHEPLPLMRARELAPDAQFCKALRGTLLEDAKTFTAIMNISRPRDRGRSMLYFSESAFDADLFHALFQP